MKKLKLFALGMLVTGLSINSVDASEIKVSDARSFISCLGITDAECVLDKDVTITTDDISLVDDDVADDIYIERDTTIDLGGHTLTLAGDTDIYYSISVDSEVKLILKNGTVVQKSSMSPVIDVDGSLETSALTIKHEGQKTAEELEDGEVMSAAITVSGTANKPGSLVTSSDTVVQVPYGNGLDLYAAVNVTLDGTWTTKDDVILAEKANANGNTNVTIIGGTYHSTDGKVVSIAKGHWIFNDGSFVSDKADAIHIEEIPKKAENLSVNINNGSFETKDEESKAISSVALTKFVFGGSFKAPKQENELDLSYIADNLKNVVEEGVTYVGVESNITIETPTNGTVTADKEKAITGQTITLNITPEEGYEIDSIIVTDTEGKTIEVVGDQFIMPSSDVTVKVEFKKEVVAESTPAPTPEQSTESEPEPENPSTLDRAPLYLALGTIALTGVAALGYSIKKKFEN